MSSVVEFCGGPWDGKTMAVSQLSHEIEIPRMQPINILAADNTDPSEHVAFRKGVYRRAVRTRVGDAFRYDWMGERDG